MILSKRAALNGVYLDTQDNSIVIRGIDIGVPHESMSAVNRMGGYGQRETSQHWEYNDVRITFAIDKKKTDMSGRKAVFDKAIAWALAKGWLTVNFISGRRLWIDKVILPSAGDLWDWTADFTITLRAMSVPLWEDDTDTTATGASITVPGIMETVCDASIVNAGNSAIDDLTVKIGNSQIAFEELELAAGETLEIGHTNEGYVTIRIKATNNTYRSAYGKRTAGSADDLYVSPGSKSITVTGGTTTHTVSCRGRYT